MPERDRRKSVRRQELQDQQRDAIARFGFEIGTAFSRYNQASDSVRKEAARGELVTAIADNLIDSRQVNREGAVSAILNLVEQATDKDHSERR